MAGTGNDQKSDTANPTPNGSQTDQSQEMTRASQESETVTLSTPATDQNQVVTVVPGMELQVAFDFNQVTVEQIGQSLILSFNEGGTITLRDFALFDEANQSPKFILQDGSEIPADLLISSLAQNEIEPAAGDSGQASGGSGEYQDNPGEILGGIDKLDGLDFAQIRESEPPEIEGLFPDDGGASGDAGTTPGVVIQPNITIENYGQTNDNTPTIEGTAAPGSTVIVEVGGVTMATTTDTDGNWSVTVPDGSPLPDGSHTITATATNDDGDISTGSGSIGIDTVAVATIALDPDITADDIINASEAGTDIAITGTVGGDAQDGDTVTLTVNGNTYTGVVNGGAFGIDVPGSALVADGDNIVEASVVASDDLGNTTTATTSESYSVDTTLPTASIALGTDITSDDIIDATEAGTNVAITGSVGGDVVDGDIVTLGVNGNTYTGVVSGGAFSIDVPGSALAADGDLTIEASVTTSTGDVNGEATATDTESYSVDTTLPTATITLDADITADDIIDATEAGTDIAITGTVGGDVADGDVVTLTVNGSTYTGAASGGAFSIDVPGSALVADGDLTIDASVTTSTGDANGEATATDTESYSVDTTLPTATITLDANITADDIIDAIEAGTDIAITGTVAGDVVDGDTVTLTVNGNTYTGVASGGVFSIDVPGSALVADGDLTIDASVTTSTGDVNGEATAIDTESYSVDISLPTASITLDANITADDIINATEAGTDIAITGTVGGNVADGDTVTLTVNGTTYTGVATGGAFSIDVPGSALVADGDLTIDASVTTTTGDVNGEATATDTESYSVDTTLPTATITLDANITADDIIDATEAGTDIAITGTVGGDVADGDTVILTVNGNTYTGAASGGSFSIDVPGSALVADGDLTIGASVTTTTGDVNGEATATDTESYSVDTTLSTATITLDANITSDDIIDATEAGTDIAITGMVGGDIADGDMVTLTVNGTTYTGAATGGAFSIDVPGSALVSDGDLTIDASVTTSTGDVNGEATATDTESYSVDTTMPTATITLDADITVDDIIDATEAGTDIAITGTVGGDVADGDTVTLTVNGTTYTGAASGGAFSIDVPGSALVSDGDLTIDASVTTSTGDVNGEATATDTESYSVDTTLPTASITLDANITADDIINAAEAGTDIAITGTVGGDVIDGDTVTLTANGNTYTGIASGGTFSIDVPGSALVADGDLTIDASVTTSTGDVNGETTATDSESYSVDTTLPTATIALDANITADDIINATEAGTDIAITGTVGGDVADGDTVTLTVNGTTYTGTASGGVFSIDVPGSALVADGDLTIDASVTTSTGDVNGEATATDTESYSIDTTLPTATIALDANITADDIINATEAGTDIAITGTVGGDVADGDTVTLTVNGNTYTGAATGGAFSIDVPGSALVSDGDLTIDASVTTSTGDVNGEATATDTESYSVDTTMPTATITLDADITADDIIDATEAGTDIAITGTVGGDVADGDTVTLTVNDTTYTGAATGGAFSIDVPGSALVADGDLTIDASVTTSTGDVNGEATANDTESYSVDTTLPTATITLDASITADDIINATEAGTDIAITGTVGGDVADGDTVTLTVNGNTYTGAASGGTFSIDVPGSALAADGDLTIDASVTTSTGDVNGEATATDTESYSVDTTLPTASITLDANITADDIINATEAGTDIAITGTVGGDVADGDTVTLTINGNTYTGAASAGTFSIDVPGSALVADGDLTIDASVTTSTGDANGEATATDTESYSVDTTLPTASISLDANITTDDIIDATEAGTDIAITGTVGGDVADGDMVTLTVNGTTYTGIATGGAFSIDVPGSALVADGDLTIDASVTTSTGGVNGEATATDTESYSVDTTLPTATIALDANITADDIIDATEAGTDIAITGTVGGDVADGDTVTLTVNGNTYIGTVSGGAFSIDVPGSALVADGDLTIDASVTTSTGDVNGEATATDFESYSVDTTLPTATIALDANITADDIINATEAGTDIAITGTVGGDVADGDVVTLTVNGSTYTGAASGGAFSIDVPGSALVADGDLTIDASVTTSTGDANGEATATDTESYSVDTTLPTATIALDADITTDDIIDATEAGTDIAISGTVGGDVADGDSVTLTVNGNTYTGAASGGAFSIDVPGSALVADGDLTIDASVTTSTGDVNGEATATDTESYSVDTTLPTATIALDADITADDIINATEAGTDIAITGTVGGDVADGDTVTLTVNGNTYTGAVSGGAFSIDVPGSALVADGDLTIGASVTTSTGDVNGEATATDSESYSVDTTLPTATITLDANITADDIIDATEAGTDIAITGTVGGDVADGDTVTLTVNGNTYTGTASGGTFSIDVPGSALVADGDLTIDASVTTSTGDVNGEATATDTESYSADTTLPTATITLDADITADDIIDATEAGTDIAITGTVGGDVADGDTVTLTVNGSNYTGTVSSGAFSIDVPGSALVTDGDLTIDASVTTSTGDVNGEATATATESYGVDTTLPTASITLDADITTDDIIDATEAGTDIAITGTVGGDVVDGDIVTLGVNGNTYTGVVSGGAFSIDVPGSALVSDGDLTIDASVTTSTGDVNGEATATATESYSVDTTLPTASITLDANITADDIINATEAGTDIAITGTVGGDVADGDTVTLTVNGNTYTGAVTGGSFSIDAPGSALVADGDLTIDASVTTSTGDVNGEATATDTESYSVDTTLPTATIALDANITADDIINATEAGTDIAITGAVGGDVADGDTVTLTVNGNTYTGAVTGGSFSIDVPGSALVADGDLTIEASVTTSTGDVNGEATASATESYSVDITLPTATIALDADITADDIINATEAGADIAITGTVGGDVADGDTVTLTVNGNTYTGTVSGGAFSIDVPGSALVADGDLAIDASVTTSTGDANGEATAMDTESYTVDTALPSASITLDAAITADDIISATEAGADIAITGTVGGDVADGDTVTLTVNGITYTGPVSGGTFTIDVPGGALVADGDLTIDASVTTFDIAGNSTTAATTETYGVDVNPPVVDLDADDSSVAGTDFVTTFTEGGGGIAIVDTDISISDVDSTSIESAAITIANVEADDLLIVGSLPAGISAGAYDSATGTITLTGSATLADYQEAISAIQYDNVGNSSGTPRIVEVTVNDGQNDSNTAVSTININMLPTVTIDDVSVQEPDAGTTTMTFTVSIDQALGSDLTFDYQTVDVSAQAGADYVGIGTTTGTILAGDTSTTITVTVNSDANVFEGDETFTLDLSNFNQTVTFESGAHLTGGGIQGVGSIGADNGPPDAVDDAFITAPDTPLVTGDVFANDVMVDNAVYASHDGTSAQGGTVTYNGDGTFTYTPAGGFSGTDTFTYTVIDDDGESDTATVSIEVSNAVINPPVVSSVPDTSYIENDAPTSILSGVSLTDVDSSTLSSVVVKIDGYIGSQDLFDHLTAGTSVNASVSVSGSTWELTLTNGASIAEYESVLNTLTYENASDNPSASSRIVTVEAYDAAYNNLFSSDSGNLSVLPVNDAPSVVDNSGFYIANSVDNGLNITVPTDPDTDDSALVITITGLPGTIGTVTLADGTPVNIGDTLTAAELETLEFDAGSADGVGQFTYSVFDGALTTDGTTTINVGATDPDAGTVYESALPGGTDSDGGAATVSGNLFANDAAAGNSIDSIDFDTTNYTPTAGVITITTALGILTVYADNSSPGFSAGDYVYELTSPDASGADVSEAFTYNFTNGVPLSDTLTITIEDDEPVANNLLETVPESEEQVFNIVLTLDISTSMNAAVGDTTRLELAKDALVALSEEYFNQSSQVEVTLLLFANGAHKLGTYTTFEDIQTAINAVTDVNTTAYSNDLGTGNLTNSTSYVDATALIQDVLAADIASQDPADETQNISYFLSDGAVTADGTPVGNGFDDFVNSNAVYSYAVGIGTGLPGDLTDLNFIHNIDSLEAGYGTVDPALIVEDVTQLHSELLSTVPTAFGGNITVDVNTSVDNVLFGADTGYVESISIELDGTYYTFSYDGSTVTVPPALAGTVEVDGSTMTLGADDGFSFGTLNFNFADGGYTFSAPNGTAPGVVTFDFSVVDGDGDAASATATINIVDDAPEARDDLHSIGHNEVAEGNVITAMGTDGGPSFGLDFTPFATQGGGVDKIVDDAVLTEFTYKDSTISLDLTLTATTVTPPDPTGGSEDLAINNATNWAATNVSLSANAGFNDTGAGISGGREDSRIDDNDGGEALTVSFDTVELPYGVDTLVLTMDDFRSANGDAVNITLYDTSGAVIDTFVYAATNNANIETIDLTAYSGIGSVDLARASGRDSQLANVEFDSSPAVPYEVVTLDQTGGDNGDNLSWVYGFDYDLEGNPVFYATVTDSDDGSTFIMNSSGYYNYTPEILPTTSIDLTSQANVDASDLSVSVSAGGTTLQYNADGVGVVGGNGALLSSGEAILISFDTVALPDGAENVVLTLNDFQSNNSDQATVIVTHDTDGDGTLTTDTVVFSAANTNWTETLDLSQFNGVTQLEIEYTGGGYDLGVGNVTYRPTTTGGGGAEPILVDYTLTDVDGQTDSAQLAIYTTDNEIAGSIGSDSIAGGALNDAISGDAGDDILSGNGGHDSISGGEGEDVLYGDDGSDYLSGGADADTLIGGAGDDHLEGDTGDDLLDGSTGDDILFGGEGSDALYGGSGDDQLDGEDGDDFLSGNAGEDVLVGGLGEDALIGGSENDILVGGKGEDILFGGDGDDTLQGGEGSDVMYGGDAGDGAGSDTFVWEANDQGTTDQPMVDTVHNFDNVTDGLAGGDLLDLRDLLQGEEENPLTDYLSFSSDGTDTTIHIDHSGGALFQETQQIVLTGVDLTGGGTISDQDIISTLIANNNLLTE